MSDNMRNAAGLREAREVVKSFEQLSGMTSEEMLASQREDNRLAQFDSFEMMDWHYALEQVRAFSNGSVLGSLYGDGHAVVSYCFLYQKRGGQDLVNAPEPELLLVA